MRLKITSDKELPGISSILNGRGKENHKATAKEHLQNKCTGVSARMHLRIPNPLPKFTRHTKSRLLIKPISPFNTESPNIRIFPNENVTIPIPINLNGGLVGRVVKVDLNEENPASWGKYLKVLVDVEVEKPLFSGCFFDVASGIKKWIQIKYEKIGILCYFCGCLGHQQRGCKLTSPVTVSNSDGIPFPMFGPWLSTLSSYPSVFSGPTVAPRGFAASSSVRKNGGALLSLTASEEGGDGEQRGSPASFSFRSTRPAMETLHGAAGLGKSKRALWLPKNRLPGVKRSIAISGFDGETEVLRNGNRSGDIPILESNNMNHRILNVLTVEVDKRNVGLNDNGPSIIKDGLTCQHKGGLSIQQKGKGISPFDQNPTFSNSVRGPPLFSNVSGSSGPQLVGSRELINSTNLLEGPAIEGDVSIAIGPNSSPHNVVGLVGGRSSLPRASIGLEQQSNEDIALAQFFKAQESLLHDLKHFGNLDLYEIRKIGGDIGVPASSEVNERTTPFKKRKFEASASLCSRPHKVPRKYPDVVRDFPWDSTPKAKDSDLVSEDPSEDSSSSPSCSRILKNPLVGIFVIDDTASRS
ncbi:hypothetical protein F8388_003545 [Cannabis sativa]|uniref:Zinc knuckle CX2CX4HX4C domain-containing protein n=1 Tax=Cannabis sativa TaxID=3483 RepID=A0A7J6EM55_CANSA|nr:hypothetical protein F8388_003545 [Cannabis sativa]